MNIKKRIYKILQPHKKNDVLSAVFDWLIITLVVADITTTILATLPVSERLLKAFNVLETVTIIILTAEYILRFLTFSSYEKDANPIKARLKYAFTFIMIVDLLAITPFYLRLFFPINVHLMRVFRLLLIFRLFKINRYIKAFSHVGNVLRRKLPQLFISTFMLFTLMIVASMLMYTVEHEAQPHAFENAFSGFWWAITTLTTVGYGDIYPITVIGKIVGAFFSLLSIAIIAVPTGIISAGFIESGRERRLEKKPKHFCSYCGEKIDEE